MRGRSRASLAQPSLRRFVCAEGRCTGPSAQFPVTWTGFSVPKCLIFGPRSLMLGSLTLGPKSVWFKVQIFNFWLQILNFRSKCLNIGSRSHFKLLNRNCQSRSGILGPRLFTLHPKSPNRQPVQRSVYASQVLGRQRMEGPPTRGPLRPWRAPAKVPLTRFRSTPRQVPSCRPRSTLHLDRSLSTRRYTNASMAGPLKACFAQFPLRSLYRPVLVSFGVSQVRPHRSAAYPKPEDLNQNPSNLGIWVA